MPQPLTEGSRWPPNFQMMSQPSRCPQNPCSHPVHHLQTFFDTILLLDSNLEVLQRSFQKYPGTSHRIPVDSGTCLHKFFDEKPMQMRSFCTLWYISYTHSLDLWISNVNSTFWSKFATHFQSSQSHKSKVYKAYFP